MLPQTAIGIIGGALITQSLLFYAFATPLTLQIFPVASDEATHVGFVIRRGLAAMLFLAGLVIFFRNDAYRITNRVLFGCVIGFAAISLSLIKNIVDEHAVIPLLAFKIYTIVAICTTYTAMRRH